MDLKDGVYVCMFSLTCKMSTGVASSMLKPVPIMRTITKGSFSSTVAITLLLGATLATSLSAASLTIPLGSLAATKSGNDLLLSFPTASPDLYTVQTSPDLLQPWTNFPSGIPGDGTVKRVTITNALSGGEGFYSLAEMYGNGCHEHA